MSMKPVRELTTGAAAEAVVVTEAEDRAVVAVEAVVAAEDADSNHAIF